MTDKKFPHTRLELEENVSLLVNQRISRVNYYLLLGDEQQESWKQGNIDSIDHGIDLELEDGRIFGITWDWALLCYHISIGLFPLSEYLLESNVADVTMKSRWAPVIGQRISKALVHWEEEWNDDGKLVEYPQDIQLTFDSGRNIYVCAAMYFADEDRLCGASDEIAVVFTEEMAQRYAVGPYRS